MEKSFPATDAGLMACQEFLSSICESPRPQIIMDEIVSNIVRCSGAVTFSVDIDLAADGALTMVFKDSGRPFDPTKTEDPDVTAPLAEREIGGLGLFMVRKMSKSVAYEYKDGVNTLTVVS